MDELFHAAEVDSVVIFFGDNQVEDVDVELAARLEVGDDELHVSTAQDVWCSGGHGGNLSSEKGGGVQRVKTDKGIDQRSTAESWLAYCLPKTGLCTSPRVMCTACWSV